MNYTRVVASLKELFGPSPKQKTPVGAGVSTNVKEDLLMSTSVSTNGSAGNKFQLLPEYLESSKTPFSKHLRWKIGTQSVEWMRVTPAMAEEMLMYNIDNRPASPSTIEKYARWIKTKQWGVKGNGTCEPIIFSDLPRLLSGQHRLQAIVVAGVAQRMLVVFGEPDGNFAYIDQGRRRTAGDVFAINKVPNCAMSAAATRLLMAHDAGASAGDQAVGNLSASNQETYDAYRAYPNLQESVKVGLKFARDRLPCPAAAAAMHYVCARKSRHLADEYFDKIASGVGFQRRNDPAKKVRDYLTRSDAGRITPRVASAVLLQGWNAMRTHKSLNSITAEKPGAVI